MHARLLLALTAVFCSAAVSGKASAPDPCRTVPAGIHVATADHRLRLCEAGHTAASYAVTLGADGTGKRKEGDGRTPLGRYRLRPPRASQEFGTFIALDYPTAAQRAQGFTGSAIGIHGPPRVVGQLRVRVPAAVLALDWTRGCIAVGSDREMNEIADWLTRARARDILIE